VAVDYSNLEMCDRQIVLQESLGSWEGSLKYPAILKTILLNRNINSERLVDYKLKNLLHYSQLKGVGAAVELLIKHLELKSSILIIGDYDVDGATSTAVAIRGLKILCSDVDVSFLVPNRFKFGYGLTVPLVHEAMKRSPNLIVTVDNGIVAHEAASLVRKNGVDLLITDHHLSDGKLPDCNALVNPNQPYDDFASKHLAGVGVMFYTLLALRAELRKIKNIPNFGYELTSLLDLVALGTVADCVILDNNNRILVDAGLQLIRKGKAHKAIVALLALNQRLESEASSQDLAFAIAPKLNAAGRMDDMTLGIQCLLSDNEMESHLIAKKLNNQNDLRKQVESKMREEAERQIIVEDICLDDKSGLTLYDAAWHEGIIGLIASRIKDRYQLPTVAFAKSMKGLLKGSARSLPGIHIREVLSKVDQQIPGLILGYGGHAMAAGLSINESDYPVFKKTYNDVLQNSYAVDSCKESWLIDLWLEAKDCQLSLVEGIESLGPFGQGFTRPIFACKMNLIGCRSMGNHHLRMHWKKESVLLESVWFNTNKKKVDFEIDRDYILVFELNINFYKGLRSLQLILHDVKI
jgi:single-stranded-DNA-specific exonuclease